MKKRAFCIITILCMMINILSPLSVNADGYYNCGDYLYYEENENGDLIITGNRYNELYWWHNDIEIPSEYNGKKVVAIGDEAFIKGLYKTVKIPEGIKTIGDRAFYACRDITELILPDGLESIGEQAFYDSNPAELILPDSVKSIGSQAFGSWSLIEKVDLPASLVHMGEHVFYDCNNIADVTIEESNEHFTAENGVLFNKDKSKIVFYSPAKPDTEYAIPEGVTDIGVYAFASAQKLEKVTFPDTLTIIDGGAFKDCTSLNNVDIVPSVQVIGNGAFGNCDSLEKIAIPASVTNCGVDTFYGCNSLKEAEIAEGITSVPVGMFYECDALERVVLPESITSIGSDAFYFCGSLKDIELPDAVTEIGAAALAYSAITEFKTPEKVTVLREGLLQGCVHLKNVYLHKNVEIVEDDVFHYCTELEEIAVEAGNANYTSINGVMFSADKKTLYVYPAKRAESAYTVPACVTNIADEAFLYNEQLEKVTLPASVETIGEFAFAYCTSLKKVLLPYGVKSFGDYAFYRCTSLESMTIPEGVECISGGAFSACSAMKSVAIPKSVKEIQAYAFEGVEALENVYYAGTDEEWAAITIENGNDYLLDITKESESVIEVPVPPIDVEYSDEKDIAPNIETELNSLLKSVTLCDTTIKGPSFEINGNVICPLEFDAKAVLDLSGLSKCITVDTDKKTVHVILGKINEDGKASVVQTTKTCDASWGKQYGEIKGLYKKMTGGDMSSRKNWNSFEKLKGELNSIKCDMFIEAEMQCVAYLDFDYQTGSLKLSEGGFIESASLGVNLNYPLVGKCLYATLGLKGSEEGTIKAVVTSSGEINPQMSIKPSLTAKASITGEIPMLCSAEGGIDATLAVILQTFDPKLTVTMGGNIFLDAKVFNKSLIDWSHPYLDVELYPEFKANDESAALTSFGTTQDIYANAVNTPRDYINHDEIARLDSVDTEYEIYGVYPDNNAELVSIGDNMQMLIWTGDDGSKSDVNRTSLMYSICSDGVWSEVQTIAEDGCAVGEFDMFADGERVYVVYQKLSQVFGDDAGVEELLAASDLYITEYTDGEFTPPICINDEGNTGYEYICELSVYEGEPIVLWIENEYNDVFLAEGETAVLGKYRQDGVWSETMPLFGTYGEEGQYPGEVNFGADGTMYFTIINSDGENTETMLISQHESIPPEYYTEGGMYNAEIIDGKLYYIKNSGIYCIEGEEETAVGINNVTSFKSVANGEKTVMIMNVPDGAGSELYISTIENGVLSTPERFTDLGKYIRSYSPLIDADGTVKVAVSAAEVNNEIEAGDDVYGATSIMVLEQCEYRDLSSSYVYYDDEAVKPDSDIELYFDVYNDSAQTLESVDVVLCDGSSNVLHEQSVSCSVAPFTSEELSIKYHLPAETAKTQLNLSVRTEGEKSYENNTVSTEIGYANLSVAQIHSVVNADRTTDIKAAVTNTGFENAESAVVTIYNGSINGDVLETIEVGNIAPGECVNVEYQFPAELMTTEENAMNAVYISVATATEESLYSDNEKKAVFASNAEETVVEPTATPTVEPTVEPTATPTVEPTVEPTIEPTAEPEPYEIINYTISDTENGRYLTDVTVHAEDPENVRVFVAVYDENGRLEAVVSKTVECSYAVIGFNTEIPYGKKIRIFMWREQLPLAEVK